MKYKSKLELKNFEVRLVWTKITLLHNTRDHKQSCNKSRADADGRFYSDSFT